MVKKKITKAQKKSFGGEGDVYGLGGGDRFWGACLSQTHRIQTFMYY